jgi:hypothetical protein
VRQPLDAWTARIDRARPDKAPLLLEALWTYQSLDVVEPNLLHTLLRDPDYRIRAAATRVLDAWQNRIPERMEWLAACVADDHPQVRLEAVRALGKAPGVRAAELALVALDRPVDQYLDYALWLTLRELEPQWMPALQQGRFDYGGNPRRLIFALQAAESRQGIGPLLDLVRSG